MSEIIFHSFVSLPFPPFFLDCSLIPIFYFHSVVRRHLLLLLIVASVLIRCLHSTVKSLLMLLIEIWKSFSSPSTNQPLTWWAQQLCPCRPAPSFLFSQSEAKHWKTSSLCVCVCVCVWDKEEIKAGKLNFSLFHSSARLLPPQGRRSCLLHDFRHRSCTVTTPDDFLILPRVPRIRWIFCRLLMPWLSMEQYTDEWPCGEPSPEQVVVEGKKSRIFHGWICRDFPFFDCCASTALVSLGNIIIFQFREITRKKWLPKWDSIWCIKVLGEGGEG